MASFHQVSPQKPYMYLSCPPIYSTCPAHLIILNLISRIILGYKLGATVQKWVARELCTLSHKGYKPQHTCTSLQQNIKIWSADVKKLIALIDREAQVYCVKVRRQQPLKWKCLWLRVLHPYRPSPPTDAVTWSTGRRFEVQFLSHTQQQAP